MDTISWPSLPGRLDPIYKPAIKPCNDPQNAAIFIFVHGLADSAVAVQNVADQFQQGGKLPHMSWLLPNARYNQETMDTAWYIPNVLSRIKPSGPDDAAEEDEEGMLETVAYLESILDTCVEAGLSLNRIILGGFSQGCAMSLLTHLTSHKYGGKLAGIAGLLGYLPLCDEKTRIQEIRESKGLPAKVTSSTPLFLCRGTKDPLIPKRPFTYTIETLKALGADESAMQVHEYEGLVHTINGTVLRDLCAWLEKVLPPLE